MTYRALLGKNGVIQMDFIFNRNLPSVGLKEWLVKYHTPTRGNRFGELKMFNPEVTFNATLHSNGEPSVWIQFLGFPLKKIAVAGHTFQEIDKKIEEVIDDHKAVAGRYTHNYWIYSTPHSHKVKALNMAASVPAGEPLPSPPYLTPLHPPVHELGYPPNAPKQVVHVYYPPKPPLKWTMDLGDKRDHYYFRIDNYDDVFSENAIPSMEWIGKPLVNPAQSQIDI